MSHVFEEREVESPEEGPVTEFTLGSTAVVLLFTGLFVVCGLCFTLGYAMGRHGDSPAAAAVLAVKPSSNPDIPLVTGASKQKPAPTPQSPAAAAPPVGDPVAAQPSADPDGDIVSPGGAAQPPSSQGAVKPAMPSQPAQSSVAGNVAVAPAMAKAQGIMVQIAAVSHIDDADVLVNALRRRGYAVSARRELADSLIHVQVGPFTNRTEADAMKLKLLNDGYNAVVEP